MIFYYIPTMPMITTFLKIWIYLATLIFLFAELSAKMGNNFCRFIRRCSVHIYEPKLIMFFANLYAKLGAINSWIKLLTIIIICMFWLIEIDIMRYNSIIVNMSGIIAFFVQIYLKILSQICHKDSLDIFMTLSITILLGQ